jgi:hypothetical protein
MSLPHTNPNLLIHSRLADKTVPSIVHDVLERIPENGHPRVGGGRAAPGVIRETPQILAANPRREPAYNCGHPTNISGHPQGFNPLRLAGLPLITQGTGSEDISTITIV